GDALYPAGHTCQSSSECANGLLCDYGVTPHACAGMSSSGTDLSVAATDGAIVNMDMSVGDLPPAPPDLTTPPDLSPTDL
ncbi:MAG: hypothetical protein ACXVH5_13805, partial [Ilumatobacteraceae bacterium]